MKLLRRRIVFFALAAAVYVLGTSCSEENPTRGGGTDTIPVVVPVIEKQIYHEPTAFTQGLLYDAGFLYESTGLNGQSKLRKVNAQTGFQVDSHSLDSRDFGEGLALKNDTLVQLTWTSHRAYVYDLAFALLDTFTYAGEGWGLTVMGPSYVMSNGSDTLYFRDDAFKITKALPVTSRGAPLYSLNELEYAGGWIYANVWKNDSIYVISPVTGEVVRIVDCTNLVSTVNPTGENVLNGIAYDDSTGFFYLTGKRWPWIFKVTVPGS